MSEPTTTPERESRTLLSGRVEVQLHTLRNAASNGDGADSTPLLLVHGLRESSRIWEPALPEWQGMIYGLDLSGHGTSARVQGGHVWSELLTGDLDAGVAALGRCAIAGRGLGAYLALLVAAARADVVPGALLLPGPGLDGGGELPVFRARPMPPRDPDIVRRSEVDPCLEQIEIDARPRNYAAAFAARASNLVWLENGQARPPWWHAAREACKSPVIAPERTAGFSALQALCR